MKLSAQISTFIVMVAALILIGIYASSITIDTDVRTADETLLPNTFTAEGEAQVAGLSFRYPRGWRVTAQESAFLLSAPKDPGNRTAGNNVFILNVVQQEGDSPLDPVTLLKETDPEVTQVEPILEEAPYPAARSIVTVDEEVSVYEVMRLTDDNLFLLVENQQAIPQDEWDAIKDDFERVMNSVSAAEVRLIPDALSYEVPATWTVTSENALGFSASTPADQALATPEAALQVNINEAQPLFDAVTNLALQFGLTPPTDAVTPLEVLQVFEGAEGGPAEISQPLVSVSYAGFEGLMIGFSVSGTEQRVIVLDTQDGYYLLGVVTVLSPEGYEPYAEDIESMMNSIQYTTPDPILFEQQAEAASDQ